MIEAYPEAKDYKGERGGDRKSFKVTSNDFSWKLLERETGRPDIYDRLGEADDLDPPPPAASPLKGPHRPGKCVRTKARPGA